MNRESPNDDANPKPLGTRDGRASSPARNHTCVIVLFVMVLNVIAAAFMNEKFLRVGEAEHPGPLDYDHAQRDTVHSEVWDDSALASFFDEVERAAACNAVNAPSVRRTRLDDSEPDWFDEDHGCDYDSDEDIGAVNGDSYHEPAEPWPSPPEEAPWPCSGTCEDAQERNEPPQDHVWVDDGRDYYEAEAFVGARPSMAFKLGHWGLGYYRDVPPPPSRSSPLPSPATRTKVTLTLDTLVPPSGTVDLQGRPLAGREPVRLRLAPFVESGGNAWTQRREIVKEAERWIARPHGVPHRRPRAPRVRSRPSRHRAYDAERPIIVGALGRRADNCHIVQGLWAVDSLNANAWETAARYMAVTAADACLLQELKSSRGPQQVAAERRAKAMRWSLSMEPSVVTDADGRSAGVATAVRSHHGLAMPQCPVHTHNLKARFHCRWWGAYCRGGVHLATIYRWVNEGNSPRNKALMVDVARALAALTGPWILAGDFNASPEELAATGWLGLLGGVIIAPREPTCGAAVLDYFIVSEGFSHAVAGVQVIEDGGFGPHRPVRLLLRPRPRAVMVRKILKPTRLGPRLPVGPLPAPDPDACDSPLPADGASLPDLDAAYTKFITRAEYEMMSLLSWSPADAHKATGRATRPPVVWRSAVGPIASKDPYSTSESRAWRQLAQWGQEIVTAMRPPAHGGSRTTSVHGKMALLLSARRRLVGLAIHGTRRDADAGERTRAVLAYSLLHLLNLGVDRHVAAAQLVAAAKAWARSEEDRKKRRCHEEWRQWLNGEPSSSLARQHRFTKVPTGWAPARVAAARRKGKETTDMAAVDILWQRRRTLRAADDGTVAPLNSQEAVDAEAEDWSMHWEADAQYPTLRWWSGGHCDMPVPTVAQMKSASRTFPEATGLGGDALHPRVVDRLSDGAVQMLITVMTLAERIGQWPSAVAMVLIILLSKPEGGFRPIGLFTMLVRVWTRMRKDQAQQWERAHDRPYLYAGKGRGARVATWRQAIRAETAAACNAVYGQSLLDLIKAFEYVPHDWLVARAESLGYPMTLIRLSLASYRLPRLLAIEGVVSDWVVAVRGITAGAGFATTELRILLIEFCDSLVAMLPSLSLTAYVDDLTLEAVGTRRLVLRVMVQALSFVAAAFSAMRMLLSDVKSVCTATDAKLGKAIAAAAARAGVKIRYSSRVKSLGVGMAAAVRRSAMIARKRLNAFRARRGRFLLLRKAGACPRKVARTGGTSAMTYAQEVMGVAPHHLLAQRRAVAAAISPDGAGKSLDLTLIFADDNLRHLTDPAFAAHVDPITMWAHGIWCCWAPKRALAKCIAAAKLTLTAAARPWTRVAAPAMTYIATAARLGWTVVDERRLITDVLDELDLTLDPPAVVKRKVIEAVRRWQWRQVARAYPALDAAGGGAAAAVAAPIRELLAGNAPKHGWWAQHRAALRSMVTNGQWPQSRLFEAKLVDEPHCQLCMAAGLAAADADGDMITVEPPRGTAVHRVVCCPHLEAARGINSTIKGAADAASRLLHQQRRDGVDFDTAWLGQALRPDEAWRIPPKSVEPTFTWIRGPAHSDAPLTFFVDASAFDTRDARLARFGWAFVAMDAEGNIVMAANGTPPSWVDSISAAEGWALLQAAQYATPADSFLTDCKTIWRALRSPAGDTEGPRALLARITTLLRMYFDDAQAVERLDWMPSHSRSHHIGVRELSTGQRLTEWHRRGNDAADHAAKQAALLVRVPRDVRRRLKDLRDGVYAHALLVGHTTVLANKHPDPPHRDSAPSAARRGAARVGDRRAKARKAVQVRPPQLGGHILARHDGKWRCHLCRRASGKWGLIAPEKCAGSAAKLWAERAAQHARSGRSDGGGHTRMMTDGIVWCARCGAYAERFAVNLARQCKGVPTPSKQYQLARLKAGRHPQTGRPLAGQAAPEHAWSQCMATAVAQTPVPRLAPAPVGNAQVDLDCAASVPSSSAAPLAHAATPAVDPGKRPAALARLAALRQRLTEKWAARDAGPGQPCPPTQMLSDTDAPLATRARDPSAEALAEGPEAKRRRDTRHGGETGLAALLPGGDLPRHARASHRPDPPPAQCPPHRRDHLREVCGPGDDARCVRRRLCARDGDDPCPPATSAEIQPGGSSTAPPSPLTRTELIRSLGAAARPQLPSAPAIRRRIDIHEHAASATGTVLAPILYSSRPEHVSTGTASAADHDRPCTRAQLLAKLRAAPEAAGSGPSAVKRARSGARSSANFNGGATNQSCRTPSLGVDAILDTGSPPRIGIAGCSIVDVRFEDRRDVYVVRARRVRRSTADDDRARGSPRDADAAGGDTWPVPHDAAVVVAGNPRSTGDESLELTRSALEHGRG